MKAAMKDRDNVKVQTLRGALAAFTNELVAKGRKPTDELTEPEMIAVLKRLASQRKDSIQQFEKGGRPELAQKEASELAIIDSYLPQGMPREEIEKIVKTKISEMNVQDAAGIGRLIGAVMKECAGRADGTEVKAIAEAILKG